MKPKLAAFAALAFYCFLTAASAQTHGQPWQATFVKNNHPDGPGRVFIDLPLPPPGKRLTVERVGVTAGPMLNNYGKLFACQIESSHPKLILMQKNEYLQDRTRILLPEPIIYSRGEKPWVIPDTPVRLYVENAPNAVFRVICTVDFFMQADVLTVTAAGYLTDN